MHLRMFFLPLLVSFLLGGTTYELGTFASVEVSGDASKGLTYINLHTNESTSIDAARQVISAHGGQLILLKHNEGRKARNVSFTVEGKRYTFDPNRIFTPAGARSSLEKESGVKPPKSVEVIVRSLALKIAGVLRSQKRVVALHNNTNGGFGVRSYTRGGLLRAEAKEVHVEEGKDGDDFFLVTSKSLFDALVKKKFNVVLQKPRPSDDGSFSVYAASRGIDYVNVEAEHGKTSEQVKMLEALIAVTR